MNQTMSAIVKAVLTVGAFGALLVAVRAGVNQGTATAVLLLAIVFSARSGGVVSGVTAAIAGAAVNLYFFLPPVGFTVDDPNDWVALVTFFCTGVIAGGMVGRTEKAARERDHFERLYFQLQGEHASSQRDEPGAVDGPDTVPR